MWGHSMAQSSPYSLVFSTCPDADTAHAIARVLVEDGLAACVSVLPGLQSVYRWQGKVETAHEHLLLIKTRADRYSRLEGVIRAHHPYELPEVVSVSIDAGLPEYLSWIDSLVGKEE